MLTCDLYRCEFSTLSASIYFTSIPWKSWTGLWVTLTCFIIVMKFACI
jgi:hypothetical protein